MSLENKVLHSVINNYESVLHTTKDPQVDTWLFMSSPAPVLLILTCYLYFVLKLGPRLMSNKKAISMKKLLVAYNLYQVIFNIWLTSVPVRLGVMSYLVSSVCNRTLTNDAYYANALSTGAWWYFISKVVDLLDTIFFVLRKKQDQVTFLHVYHHTTTCLFSWGYLKYLPGEQGIVIGFLNSAVHILMYTYYMVAALGPEYAKYLWWKKYLTWMQLVQFFLMLTYLLSLLVLNCQLPKALTFFFTGNVVIFLYLFSRFYRKAYRKKKTPTLKNTIPRLFPFIGTFYKRPDKEKNNRFAFSGQEQNYPRD
ncbi:hypothetical protein RUM43_008346 [Polyplax serrata]|uniref:Elongation of very long chain fatty acids protein n=1 Tax=Polyplax serrata TaxID=468196 RepID=A0AAN8S8Z3_POLSC